MSERSYFNEPAYPDPTEADLESPEFNAIWDAIKGWDVSRYNNGLYAGANGSDVMHILAALRRAASDGVSEDDQS